MSFSILGTGHALPHQTVTNHDFCKILDTSDEWIVSKTGIQERHILSNESLTDLAVTAAQNAFENAKIDPKEIDLVLCATLCGDTHTPSQACLAAKRLNLVCPAFDINAACSGFIYALDIAAGFFVRKRVKKVLILCAEQMSRLLDFSDRSTCVLFGDGAAAVILGEGNSLLSIKISATPDDQIIRAPFTGGKSPFNKRECERPFLTMLGQEVYRFAVVSAVNDLEYVMREAKLGKDEIAYVLLHQANMRISEAVRDKTNMDKEKFLSCIQKTGNISAVTIPMLLDEANRQGILKKGDVLAMAGFGAGLTTAACLLRWGAEDTKSM